MRPFSLLTAMLLMLGGCASMPILPSPTFSPDICSSVFPQKPLSLVYRMDASIPFQAETTLIGVAAVEPRIRTVRVLLLSPEGSTLLDARQTGEAVEVLHALPPFDREAFASGVLADVSLVLLSPRGEPVAAGDRENQCAWGSPDHRVELKIDDNGWQLTLRHGGRIERTVRADRLDGDGVPQRLRIEAAWPFSYTLRFSLLEVSEPAASP